MMFPSTYLDNTTASAQIRWIQRRNLCWFPDDRSIFRAGIVSADTRLAKAVQAPRIYDPILIESKTMKGSCGNMHYSLDQQSAGI